MTTRYVVAPGRSVIDKSGNLIAAGTVLNPEFHHLSESSIREHCESGFVYQIGEDPVAPTEPPAIKEDNVGDSGSRLDLSQVRQQSEDAAHAALLAEKAKEAIEVPAAAPVSDWLSKSKAVRNGDTAPSVRTSAGAEAPASLTLVPDAKPEDVPAPGAKSVSDGLWCFDAAELGDVDLEGLNVLILERDNTVKPYETREEAMAHLSQDLNGEG